MPDTVARHALPRAECCCHVFTVHHRRRSATHEYREPPADSLWLLTLPAAAHTRRWTTSILLKLVQTLLLRPPTRHRTASRTDIRHPYVRKRPYLRAVPQRSQGPPPICRPSLPRPDRLGMRLRFHLPSTPRGRACAAERHTFGAIHKYSIRCTTGASTFSRHRRALKL